MNKNPTGWKSLGLYFSTQNGRDIWVGNVYSEQMNGYYQLNKTASRQLGATEFKLTGVDPRNCPVCGQGKMIIQETIHASGKAPFKSLRLPKRSTRQISFNWKIGD